MKKIFGILLLLISGAVTVAFLANPSSSEEPSHVLPEAVQAEEPDRVESVTIESGDTFGLITERLGINPSDSFAILDASTDVYDFTSIRVGKSIDFYFDKDTDDFYKILYEPNSEIQVISEKIDETWTTSKSDIEYNVKIKTVEGTIDNSLYVSALEAGLDERAVIDLAEIFAWQIDFAIDIRTGDTFKMIYEERYRNNEYVMPGQILAASFNNNGTLFEGFYYYESEDNEGYFDRDGASLQKIFLKSPIQYRYISSGFGSRRDPITRAPSWHTGIDYAAPYGTPAVTVGDGTIVRAGWNGGYGNSVDVRHNETYTTRYGHFSSLAVSVGEKVKQGDIVGYVGSTGWSTGPHLHYEMHKFGSQVDPFTVDIPSGKAISEENFETFKNHIAQFEL